MNTPIYDFVTRYRDLRPVRLHMPGHKGRGPLGCEELDVTEIPGADSLYEAAGIIAESERNASRLFGCPTFYSTEGSSHCIRAMLALAYQLCHSEQSEESVSPSCDEAENLSGKGAGDGGYGFLPAVGMTNLKRFRVLAARNVHKTFLSAAALLDLDVRWLPRGEDSYLSARVSPEILETALRETGADAVYLTCPDYLGELPDLRPLAEVCHAHGALLLVDNAHGAYLRFLTPSRHPMDLGADLCCDSAHKTLPVLTGGAYLHIQQGTGNREQGTGQAVTVAPAVSQAAKDALALFGSTSPSYLILQSLDLANPYLERLPGLLGEAVPKIDGLKEELFAAGYRLYGQEPLKLTLDLRETALPGTELARRLEEAGIWCEFADPDFVVLMLTPQTTDEELARLCAALLQAAPSLHPVQKVNSQFSTLNSQFSPVCSLRAAMLAPCERIPAGQSLGRVLARPGVSCPPAVPILMPGERIDEAALEAFRHYGVAWVDVL